MFDDRARTEITANERTQTERALQKLDQAFTDNRMTKAMYLARRERLVKNLERVISAPTPLVSNPAGFYDRNALNLSPRPTGYQESLATAQDLDGNMRKASESQIRQAALENATADAEAASIMDALQSNAAPNNFQAALNSVNEIQQSQLLGTTRTDFKGVWKDIADSPAVVNALRNLSESVQSRVESAMAQGMPVIAAENYIISNARNAGAILTKQGYDRGRAAEIVKSVIDGEISMVAAQNIVSADLREATSAVISNNTNYAMQPTVSPNAAKVNTDKRTSRGAKRCTRHTRRSTGLRGGARLGRIIRRAGEQYPQSESQPNGSHHRQLNASSEGKHGTNQSEPRGWDAHTARGGAAGCHGRAEGNNRDRGRSAGPNAPGERNRPERRTPCDDKSETPGEGHQTHTTSNTKADTPTSTSRQSSNREGDEGQAEASA